jgi:putative tryptophan/tyrosine transport system substrate-binding protein
MRRREFIAVLGTAAVRPLTARAQQVGRTRRVGILMDGTATSAVQQSLVMAFTEALARQGWIEGKNVTIDIRYNAADATLARIFAAQLIGIMPDVILSASTTNLMILREVTSTVPIVFTIVSGPVEQGFIASLAKPGGNITGFGYFEFSIGGKWLDLLKEIAPALTRIAVMFNPYTSPQSKFFMRSIESAGRALGVTVTSMPIHSTADIEPAISGFARRPDGGLILPPDSFMGQRSKLIADTANLHRLPSLGANFARYARNDGLMMYYGVAVNLVDQFRQAANYVDRILKGEKPADLPVQQPTKFELVINLETAKALGLTIPETLLATADEVIQ